MFATFKANTAPEALQNGTAKTTTRAKRKQVARACDWCRANRIKCDDQRPCKNCRSRGSMCSNSRTEKFRTIPAATREIGRLQARVKDLEIQLSESRQQVQYLPLPTLDETREKLDASSSLTIPRARAQQWGGAWLSVRRGGDVQHHARSSSLLFMSRVQTYLHQAMHDSFPRDVFKVDRADLLCTSPTMQSGIDSSDTVDNLSSGGVTTREQEEYYLNLFWQSYHLIMPFLCEKEFREYYRSLWPAGNVQREPSALVDIMLALCVQYSAAFASQDLDIGGMPTKDSSVAGRWLYERSQRLLLRSQESPSLSALQTHLFAVVFLNNASLPNTAYQILAVAIRISHLLGLNCSDTGNLMPSVVSGRQLVWRSLFILDSKMSIDLGRPFMIDSLDVSLQARFSVPRDGEPHSTSEGVEITDFHRQSLELVMIVRAAHQSYNNKCGELLAVNNAVETYDDLRLLEDSAQHLFQCMSSVQKWTQNVPEPLKLSRRGSGPALSITCSELNTDTYIPLWLQRQRLLLELLYHSLVISLYRPFIRFPPEAGSMTALSREHSVSCLKHAIMITEIIGQVTAENGVLSFIHSTYNLQWDAMVVITGFALGHLLCPHTSSARKAIKLAIRNFHSLAENNLGGATTAENITRNLYECIEALAGRLRVDSSTAPHPRSSPQSTTNTSSAVQADLSLASTRQNTPSATADGFCSTSAATFEFSFEDNISFNGAPDLTGLDEWTDWTVDSAIPFSQPTINLLNT